MAFAILHPHCSYTKRCATYANHSKIEMKIKILSFLCLIILLASCDKYSREKYQKLVSKTANYQDINSCYSTEFENLNKRTSLIITRIRFRIIITITFVTKQHWNQWRIIVLKPTVPRVKGVLNLRTSNGTKSLRRWRHWKWWWWWW